MLYTVPTLCPRLSAQVFECESISPTLALPRHRSWYVQVDWTLADEQNWPCLGKWLVQVFIKPFGQRREIPVPPAAPEKVAVVPGQSTYRHKLAVSPEAIGMATLYQLVTVLTFEDERGELAPLASVVAGPLIQFYEPN